MRNKLGRFVEDFHSITEFKKGHKINLGKHHSEETKKKMSETRKGHSLSWLKGKHLSEEHKGKLSKIMMGRIFTSEWKGKISKSLTGKKLSLEHCKSISRGQKGRCGDKASNWQGGKTPLNYLIRESEKYVQWRKQIFERDNYTCQECYNKGEKLHLHHKRAFTIILQEFLNYYSQFSPIEDKETLLRLAITYEPFWDMNNGISMCKECHKKTDSYCGKIERSKNGK